MIVDRGRDQGAARSLTLQRLNPRYSGKVRASGLMVRAVRFYTRPGEAWAVAVPPADSPFSGHGYLRNGP